MSPEHQSLLVRRLTTLARWRRLILLNTVIVAICAIVVSLLLPEWYRSTASVFPPQEETMPLGDGRSMAAVAANVLGRGRSGTSLFSSPSDLYATILKSRSVSEALIRRFDLLEEFEVETIDEGLEILKRRMKIRVGTEGVVRLAVVDRDPARAAEIANTAIGLLDAKAQQRVRSSAGAVRAFLERRVAETRDSLAAAEGVLLRVQEQTGILVPEDQARALIESAVQIELGKKMREVELGMLKAQVGPNDPNRARLSREIELLESQLVRIDRGVASDTSAFRVPLSEIPERSALFVRALRDVKIHEAVYELLTEQYETHRILELRDTPSLQVLDAAVAPEKRWRPIRSLVCIIATAIAFFLSCGLAFILDGFARMRRDEPATWDQLRRAASNLHPKRWFSSGHDLPAP